MRTSSPGGGRHCPPSHHAVLYIKYGQAEVGLGGICSLMQTPSIADAVVYGTFTDGTLMIFPKAVPPWCGKFTRMLHICTSIRGLDLTTMTMGYRRISFSICAFLHQFAPHFGHFLVQFCQNLLRYVHRGIPCYLNTTRAE